jgi:hypothetical protein
MSIQLDVWSSTIKRRVRLEYARRTLVRISGGATESMGASGAVVPRELAVEPQAARRIKKGNAGFMRSLTVSA